MTKVTQLRKDYTLKKDLHKSLGISLGDGCQVLSCCVIESHWKMTVSGRSSIQFWFISGQLEQTLWVAVAVAAKRWSSDSGCWGRKETRTGARFKMCGEQTWMDPRYAPSPLWVLSTHLQHPSHWQKSNHLSLKGPAAAETRPDKSDWPFYLFTGRTPAKNALNFPFQQMRIGNTQKKVSVIFSLLQNKVPCSDHLIFGWIRHLNLHIMYGFFCFHPLPRFKIYGYHLGWFQFPLIICATDVHLSDFNHVVVTGLA